MTKDAFVIMPFSETAGVSVQQWDDTFEFVFKPAFVEAGFTCDRAQPVVGGLVDSIVERLRNAAVVLADVTGRNANVFYELGVRHALRKGTILVSRDGQLPSDLGGQWHLRYGTEPREVATFKREIARLLEFIAREPERADNPVAAYLDRESLSSSTAVNRDNAKRISALITELTGNALVLRGIIAGREVADALSLGCLDLLCSTYYIDLGPDLLAQAYEVRNALKRALTTRPSDPASLLQAVDELRTEMGGIRERLLRGEYSEPTAISFMAWSEEPALPSLGISWDLDRNPLTEICENAATATVCAVCGGVSRTQPCPACGRV